VPLFHAIDKGKWFASEECYAGMLTATSPPPGPRRSYKAIRAVNMVAGFVDLVAAQDPCVLHADAAIVIVLRGVREKAFWPKSWFCAFTWMPVTSLGLSAPRIITELLPLNLWSSRKE